MAEILSLSKARKSRLKAEKEANAAANRAKFGRTKAEKAADECWPGLRSLRAGRPCQHRGAV